MHFMNTLPEIMASSHSYILDNSSASSSDDETNEQDLNIDNELN